MRISRIRFLSDERLFTRTPLFHFFTLRPTHTKWEEHI